MIEITSFKNEKIKLIEKLKNKNKRDKSKLFLIEGYRELLRAEENNIEIEAIFFSKMLFLGENENDLIDRFKSKHIDIYNVKKEIFEKISYRDRPDGLLAIAKQKINDISFLKKIIKTKKNPFLLVLEAIEKPGNLGSILRTCDACGVDSIIVCDLCTDIFNPNVVRASTGTLFSQNVVITTSLEAIEFLKENNITIIATTPNTKKLYTEINLKNSIAIAMGTEQYGLSEKWLKAADIKVKIPMFGIADSLNVSAATTIMLYETIRQRKLSKNSF